MIGLLFAFSSCAFSLMCAGHEGKEVTRGYLNSEFETGIGLLAWADRFWRNCKEQDGRPVNQDPERAAQSESDICNSLVRPLCRDNEHEREER